MKRVQKTNTRTKVNNFFYYFATKYHLTDYPNTLATTAIVYC